MEVAFDLSVNNGGSPIDFYELQINDGTDIEPSILVTTYDGISTSHILDDLNDPIVDGGIYKLRIRAHNARGYGEWSTTLRAGVTPKPTAPAALSRVELASTRT